MGGGLSRFPRPALLSLAGGLGPLFSSLSEGGVRAGGGGGGLPRHVGVIMDGNRRWAKAAGFDDPSQGHHAGAQKIEDLLGWCDDAGIGHVTIYLLATDNLARPPEQLEPLLRIIENVVTELAAPGRPWQ